MAADSAAVGGLPDKEEGVYLERRFVDQLKQGMAFGNRAEFHVI